MSNTRTMACAALACVVALMAACGGAEDPSSPPPPPSPPSSPPSAPSPPGVLIGAAGGTVTGPRGAQVVIPAGALASEVRINIEETSAGAPALPTGVVSVGPTFALTPHGTTFAVPVTLTLPYDSASV